MGQVTANRPSTGSDFPAKIFFEVFVETQFNAGTLLDATNTVVACVIHSSSHIPEDPSHILDEHQLLLIQQKLHTTAPGR